MKRFFTIISVPTLLLASALPVAGAGPVLSFDFEDESTFTGDFTVIDGNNDNVKWQWAKYSSGSRTYQYAKCNYWDAKGYNDMMTIKTPCHLEKGHAYILKFQGWAEDTGTKPDVTIAVGYYPSGDENNISRIFSKNSLTYINKYQGEEPASFETGFEVDETGDYFITFMAIGSAGGGVSVDNIILTDAGSPQTPQPASSVVAKAADDFSLSATLAITLPSKTMTGKDLGADGITKVEIYRGETLAQTLTSGLTPGETVNWSDANAAAGMNSYKVIIYNGDLASAAAETSVYVGPMTPNSPTSVLAAKGEGGKIKITWSAPTLSAEEQALNPELITYNVYRKVNDGDSESIAAGISATEYEDTFTSDDFATVVYTVEAVYSNLKSEGVASNAIKVGSYSLPFEESFANAILPDDWEVTSTDTSTWNQKKWTAASRMNSSPNASPYDGDGGLLTYNSYSASRNYQSQAITPEINLNGVTSPVLEFQFYHSTNSSSNSDRVVIEVSKDGGDFEELEMEPLNRYDGSTGWKLHQYPLAAYSDARSIRISFKAISDYGADMAIDAVRVFAGAAHDLEAGAIEAVNAEVNSGEEAEFKFTVKNVSFGNVSGEDYTVKTYLEGELLATLEGEDIEAAKSVDFTFTVPSHAGHAEAGLPVYAEIVYAADEHPENNVSDEIIVNVKSYGGEGVSDLTGSVDGSTLRLSWSAVEIVEYDKVESELTLDREEDIITKEAFEEDNSLAWPAKFVASDGGEWTNIDKDGLDLPRQFNMPAGKRGFMFSSWEMTGNSSHKDNSGVREHGMFVASAPSHGKGTASDYLVSPVIPGRGTHTLEFVAKSYSSACLADFFVEYSTSDYTVEDIEEKFIPVGEKVHINSNYQEGGKWTSYSYLIPADAKYVAIHFVGEAGVTYEADDPYGMSYSQVDVPSVLCVDDIKFVSEPTAKPTYNVYYREINKNEDTPATFAETSYVKAPQKHNESPIEDGEYVLALPSVATDFHVSAVYPQGETSLSTPFSYNVPSGVENVVAENTVAIKAEGRTISAYSAGEEMPVSVYAADGTVLALDSYGFTVAAPGAYIVKAAEKAVTIIIR